MTKSTARVLILDAYPDRACYRPGEAVQIVVEVRNDAGAAFVGRLAGALVFLAEPVGRAEAPLRMAPGQELRLALAFQPPDDDFCGYGVDLRVVNEVNQTIAEASTALDVLSNWALAPRYGFFADFAPGQVGDAARAAARDAAPAAAPAATYADAAAHALSLSKYHVNVVQFYDWMWRHYALLPPPGADEFLDGMGRRLSLRAVEAKIAALHGLNMAALAYGAVYGAEPEYFLAHPEQALFKADGTPESIEKLFYVMNIAPGSPWNDLIVDEYVKAVTQLDFDGIHIDQYGFPLSAHAGGADGPLVDVGAAFAPLIERSAQAVGAARPAQAARPGGQVIFNNVNDWPTALTAPASQAAVYIEVWPPHESYRDLQDLIVRGKLAAGGEKQVILAAYVTPLCLAKGKPEDVPGAEEAARLAAAAIFANGGFHLLLGEDNGALCDPYYPRYATLRPEFVPVIRAYYDFAVRYENWLFDPALAPLPPEDYGPGGRVQIWSPNWSAEPEAGKVWAIARQSPGALTLSLLNLTDQVDDRWNAPHRPPTPQHDIPVSLPAGGMVKAVWLATPDDGAGRAQPLDFEQHRDRVSFTVPTLDHWDLLLVEFGG